MHMQSHASYAEAATHKEGEVEIDEQTDMLFLNYNFVLKNFQFCYPLYVDNRTTVIYK